MLGCDKTVTITHLAYDGQADKDVEQARTFAGCSWYGQTKAAVSSGGLQSASLYKCRIPEEAAGDRHRYDILGKDSPTYNLTFEARLPFGAAVASNIDAADFFDKLANWLNVQNRIRNWPEIDGYQVNKMTASNAGLINQADAGTARYQLQISLEMEEE